MTEKKKRSRPPLKRRLFIAAIVVFLICGGLYYLINRPPTIYINPNGDDLLFYTYAKYSDEPDPHENMLMMYNPRTNQSQALIPRPTAWKVSSNGQIAYLDGDKDIVLSEIKSIGQPYEVIKTFSDYPRIFSWSPKGNYLLYSDRDDLYSHYIWDGEQSINITPSEFTHSDGFSYYIHTRFPMWSESEYLAFGVSETKGGHQTKLIVYVWDSNTLHTLYDTRFLGWNSDGQLMLTDSDFENPQRWDGQSYVDGHPKIEPISDLRFDSKIYRAAYWANGDNIVYRNEDGEEGYSEYYSWDGESLSYIDRIWVGMGSSAWRFNERGERMRLTNDPTIGQHGAVATSYIHLRDRNNNPIIDINGHMPTWSNDGYIAFCAPLHRLSIYNGHEIILIEDSWTVYAQWQSGRGLACHNG